MAIILGIFLLIIFLPLLIKKPFLIIWLTFFLYILGPYIERLMKFQLHLGVNFVIALLILTYLLFIRQIAGGKLEYRFFALDGIMLALMIVGIVSYIASDNKEIAFLGLKDNFKPVFLFLFIRIAKPKLEDLAKFNNIFLAVAVIAALYGIYQYFFNYYGLINMFGGVSNLSERYFGLSSSLGGQLGAKRAYSIFLNNFTLAYYLMISLMIIFAADLDRKRLVFSGVIIFCFILTFTRSAWMGFLFGCLSMALFYGKAKAMRKLLIYALSAALVLSIVFVFLPGELKTAITNRFFSIFSLDPVQTSMHYEYLKRNVELLKERPFGIGLGKATAYIGEEWNESSIFKIITELGIFVGILYILIFLLSGIHARRLFLISKDSEIRRFALITFGLLAAYFTAGVVFPIWTAFFPTMILWLYIGQLFNLAEASSRGAVTDEK